MKKNSIFLGVFFIFIGLFWLLSNMGLITWSIWEAVVDLWPLVFVIIGISIIFNDKNIIKSIAWIIFLVIIFAYGFFIQYNENQPFKSASPSFELQSNQNIKNAELSIDLSGVNLNIDSTKNNLINTSISSPYVIHNVSYGNNNETASIEFKEKKHRTFPVTKKSYNATYNLSDNIIWDIDANIGAVNGKIDLNNIKAKSLDIDCGAGKLDIMLGTLLENSNIDIEAGATSVNLIVPSDLGVKIRFDGGLKSSNLGELGWTKTDTYYISPNYTNANSKVDIDIDIGVGNLSVDIK
ncbi:LiaF transmembrane domain-containing protein [Brassicibacter mesophilus]|uniref:LiaF transmembrane domain-containing protein n=1 Tax=Brassicibacter mesophilus TaxID=745119 RepID=UPI003D262540